MSKEKSLNTLAVVPDRIHAMNSPITGMVCMGSWSTSRVKSTPPVGDLNIPAIPAPAPIPMSMRSHWSERPNQRPTLLPMAAPLYATGPSEPAVQPKPMVRPQVSTEFRMEDFVMRYLPEAMARESMYVLRE